MQPEFHSPPDVVGVEIVDPIETRQFTLGTESAVTPTPATTEAFPVPLETACRIRTRKITLPYTILCDVRESDGTPLVSVEPTTTHDFPPDEYLLELHAPMKLYLRVQGSFRVVSDTDRVRFDFGEQTGVHVGARSFHRSPAGTITVTDDPRDAMEAVSAFASGLKTTSPERSWPTLRGHPPRIERGDRLDVPAELAAPETDITIEVPPEHGAIYTVAPLSYYLGATVRPGKTPRLTAGKNVERRLGDDLTELADVTERLLKRTVLLDCITRTEGLYPDPLAERDLLESHVDLDFAALYDASISERLETYLSIPDEAVDAVTPTWHRVTFARPDLATLELLPYVVADLSLVRVKAPSETAWTATERQRRTDDALGAFKRRDGLANRLGRPTGSESPRRRGGEGDEDGEAGYDGSEATGERTSVRGVPGDGGLVPLPDADALERAWVGDETPVHGAKLLRSAFERDEPESSGRVIDITVVCNDAKMREEWNAVTEIYEGRDDVRVNVDCQFGISTAELAERLSRNSDLFHFVGHIDGRGFACPDGVLDAATLDDVGATTLLLNGCRSHDQGIELVEAGASAAVVSLADLWNSGAVEVGETLARLLHQGFNFGSSMAIVREYTSLGREYVVVGDPGVTVAQCENTHPTVYHVTSPPGRDGEVTVELRTYPTRMMDIGSIFTSFFEGLDNSYVGVGFCGEVTLSIDEFRETLDDETIALVDDGELVWSDEWLSNR